MKKITEIIKKVWSKEIILYAIFGIFTTLVNLGVFYLLTNIVHLEGNLSNVIAILLAVVFAYLTNKDFVFHSNAKTIKDKTMQFLKFISGRAFTMIIEWGGCALLFITPIPQFISKLFMTIVIIILNFFISKFLVF